ncbi:unnamed protein product [Cuscuta campestris]|uniref:Protein kinase domain-containing protein n=1 Tax=Cuscuta campestris TaxID=132261 RepID=A0A484MUM3_9ASTE|nr:unnamed protein product [Cuscuta campestris]
MRYCFSSSKIPSLKWAITAAAVILLTRTAPFCCAGDPRIEEASPVLCGRNMTSTFVIAPLFTAAMESLSQSVTARGWGYSGVVNSTLNASIYALAQCYGDLPRRDCLLCFASSRTKLPRCLPRVSGRIFLDGCFIRYDDFDFFNQSTDPDLDRANCSSSARGDAKFEAKAGRLIARVAGTAAARGGYASAKEDGVYGLAQCWKKVSGEGCRVCLEKARREAKRCFPSREGRALNAGCYLRYSAVNFIGNPNEDDGGGSVVSKQGVKAAIGSSVTAFIMVVAFAGYTCRVKALKRKQERRNLGAVSSAYNSSNLNFKYETLEKATNYFDPSTKLGQGGAGSVYKGTLGDGRIVAVKRLFFNTRQWVDEFFNEVNLVSGIEHKNLVKLLGCSIEGPESLLVYEFVPNKSLAYYLFDENRVKTLTWRERFSIVVGTAEGIAFLHEGTATRIIHRDIKTSNVLLDENFCPKIADFGLARCFAADKTHLSTGIAGTLGYMAPEYLVKGQLTEKADVYSFGVLLLEIISGRKSNAFVDDSGSLLQTVWGLYKSDRTTELIEPCLRGHFHESEASRVVQVGLLCCQAVASLRPSMCEVVKMLTMEDYEIPETTQPPFINSTMLEGGSMRSIKALVSNALKLHDVSTSLSTTDQSCSMKSSSEEFQRR